MRKSGKKLIRITFEGPDGSGKSWHATRFMESFVPPTGFQRWDFRHERPSCRGFVEVNDRFRSQRHRVRRTATAWCNDVEWPYQGCILITDRWTESAIAYGLAAGNLLMPQAALISREEFNGHMELARLESSEDREIFDMNIVILMYADNKILLERVMRRPEGISEARSLERFLRNGLVSTWYKCAVDGDGETRHIAIDTGHRDKSDVAKEINDFVSASLADAGIEWTAEPERGNKDD